MGCGGNDVLQGVVALCGVAVRHSRIRSRNAWIILFKVRLRVSDVPSSFEHVCVCELNVCFCLGKVVKSLG